MTLYSYGSGVPLSASRVHYPPVGFGPHACAEHMSVRPLVGPTSCITDRACNSTFPSPNPLRFPYALPVPLYFPGKSSAPISSPFYTPCSVGSCPFHRYTFPTRLMPRIFCLDVLVPLTPRPRAFFRSFFPLFNEAPKRSLS